MKIFSAFHARLEPEHVLRRKLATSLLYPCDRVLVVLDRWPQAEPVVGEFGDRVEFLHDVPVLGIVRERDEWGRLECEEGRLRQLEWDWCAKQANGRPAWFVFGDADEILTAAAPAFFRNPPEDLETDVYATHILNVWGDRGYLSGPDCIYSPENPGSQKRWSIVRYKPGARYDRFDERKMHHTQLAPLRRDGAPMNVRVAEFPATLHYKWEDLSEWEASAQSKSPKYSNYLASCTRTSPIPREMRW